VQALEAWCGRREKALGGIVTLTLADLKRCGRRDGSNDTATRPTGFWCKFAPAAAGLEPKSFHYAASTDIQTAGWRSSSVDATAVAAGMIFIPPTNHDSRFSDSGY
jgi:hypothetical protein